MPLVIAVGTTASAGLISSNATQMPDREAFESKADLRIGEGWREKEIICVRRGQTERAPRIRNEEIRQAKKGKLKRGKARVMATTCSTSVDGAPLQSW